ncbi:alginate export family protein [Pseudomaricurvus sp. HS19]|uniref:alginate export family protein n=1 Tax=Pseudomaricurvus sp. HS19 TaxID=2692626 RepID=UPI00136ED1E4|nr:alginate export family protein [Pseudomaricurvus sp. HS19]MYM63172.1 alginate export family protein [Pseudomaricurvus sp. HS19]
MKHFNYSALTVAVALACGSMQAMAADSITEALTGGKAYGDFRLRYESVEQDNALEDAEALTLRSRLGYVTDTIAGFSATLEFEDSRVVAGMDEYEAYPTAPVKEYSVIADPETTEVDQAFLQYKAGMFTTKLGRQVLTFDNQRFIGHVGWRQDRQTFDAATFTVAPTDSLSITYSYLDQRNRILAEDGDINSEDHLLNASFKTSLGTLSGYSYLLETYDTGAELDTYGVRFAGGTSGDGVNFVYELEYATQETGGGATDFDADYYTVVGGVVISGITAKLGYEVLGSDDGDYGFSTPLATGHAFNGWADIFLGTPKEGLEDLYVSVGGKIGPGALTVIYHEFTANEASATVDDLGSEVDVVYGMKFGKNYNAGIKYAAYSADDYAVDTDKIWLWVGASF